jgi:hypothetical protein
MYEFRSRLYNLHGNLSQLYKYGCMFLSILNDSLRRVRENNINDDNEQIFSFILTKISTLGRY